MSRIIRPPEPADRAGIREVEIKAFGQAVEADLVDALVASGDMVLELVAMENGGIAGHIAFSRLFVESGTGRFPAVALAPLAVLPQLQKTGIGAALTARAHGMLRDAGEKLSVVLGSPAYYCRFSYSHARAAGFASPCQGAALQALAWGDAPVSGRLVYAPAFAGL